MRTLVVIRHAKSDWEVPAADEDRPLAPRGRRQAPETGRWLAEHVEWAGGLAVVSPAARAVQTWELVSAELPAPPRTLLDPRAYTFSGDDLLEVVAGLPDDVLTAALVGHNPAVEELVEGLTGRWVRMPTTAIAVVAMQAWDAGSGRLRAAGRPADGPLGLD